MNSLPTPPPMPFGDPTQVRTENQKAIGKGVMFGCGGCGILVVLGALFAAGIFAAIMGVMRQSDAYTETISHARASVELKVALGEPIEPGWMMMGNININNDAGHADITIPFSGPKGEASVHVVATKTHGAWKYEVMTATISKGGAEVDLLNAEAEAK